jgi:hypothetical protein
MVYWEHRFGDAWRLWAKRDRGLRIVSSAVGLAALCILLVPFLVTAGMGIFEPHPVTPSFGAGDSGAAALGDLDNDNDLDVVVANNGVETVWLNDGAGSFTAHPTTPSFGAGDSLDAVLGDIDEDGDLDAIIVNLDGEAETVWLNDGGGNFGAHPTTPSFGAGYSFRAELGDLDNDDDLDVVVANADSQTVWLNDGGGNFSAHPVTPSFSAEDSSFDVALGDIDGDGDLDALVASPFGNEVETVWLNDGVGNFSAHPTTPTFGAGGSLGITLGDFDSDTDLDAVVANARGNEAETVWLNDGAGNFSAHPTVPSFGAGESYNTALGDLDNDGDLDAVVANAYNQAETVWLNDGSGGFSAHPTTPSFGAQTSYDVALGDLDGDNDLDAIVANYVVMSGGREIKEPETVWLNSGTASVQLAGFYAISQGDYILLGWETISEQDNQGFNVLRGTSANAPAEQLNEALIPSQAPDSSEGFGYEWIDAQVQQGTTYYYWLEDVDVGGRVTRHGPVSATIEAPTALTINGIEATKGSRAHWGMVGAMGLVLTLLGARTWRRRLA